MASSNFSKIVRKNSVVKPWMVKKATDQILTQCMRLDSSSCAIAAKVQERAEKFDNEGPLRTWQVTQVATKKKNNLIAAAMKACIRGHGLSTSGTKKLLKLPTIKLNSARKYGSGVHVSERSINYQTTPRTSRTFQRMFGSADFYPKTKNRKPNLTKNFEPIRNQHMTSYLGSLADAQAYSNLIAKELMDVSTDVKKLIAVGGQDKQTFPSYQAEEQNNSSLYVAYKFPMMLETRLNERSIAAAGIDNQIRQLRNLARKPINKIRKLASSFTTPSSATLKKTSRTTPRRVTPGFSNKRMGPVPSALWGRLVESKTGHRSAFAPSRPHEEPTESQIKMPRRRWPRGCEPIEEKRPAEPHHDSMRQKPPAAPITEPAEEHMTVSNSPSILSLGLMPLPVKQKKDPLFQFLPTPLPREPEVKIPQPTNLNSTAAAASHVWPRASLLRSHIAEAGHAPSTKGGKSTVNIKTNANKTKVSARVISKNTKNQKPKAPVHSSTARDRAVLGKAFKQPNLTHASKLSSRALQAISVSPGHKGKPTPPKSGPSTVKSTARAVTKPGPQPVSKAAAQRTPTKSSAPVPKARPQSKPVKPSTFVPKESAQKAKPLTHMAKETTKPTPAKVFANVPKANTQTKPVKTAINTSKTNSPPLPPLTQVAETTPTKTLAKAAKPIEKRDPSNRKSDPVGWLARPTDSTINKPKIAETSARFVQKTQSEPTIATSSKAENFARKTTLGETFAEEVQSQSRIQTLFARQGYKNSISKARKELVDSMAPATPTATATASQHGRPMSKYSAPRFSHMGFIKRKTNY